MSNEEQEYVLINKLVYYMIILALHVDCHCRYRSIKQQISLTWNKRQSTRSGWLCSCRENGPVTTNSFYSQLVHCCCTHNSCDFGNASKILVLIQAICLTEQIFISLYGRPLLDQGRGVDRLQVPVCSYRKVLRRGKMTSYECENT